MSLGNLEHQQDKQPLDVHRMNRVLDAFIDHVEKMQPEERKAFFETEGIFRLSGTKPVVDALADHLFQGDGASLEGIPTEFQDPHVIVGAFKRSALGTQTRQWTPGIKALFNEFNESMKNEDFSKRMRLDVFIKRLAEEGAVEEAKALHNMLYLASLAATEKTKNKMGGGNLVTILGPSIDKLFDHQIAVYTALPLLMNPLLMSPEEIQRIPSYDTAQLSYGASALEKTIDNGSIDQSFALTHAEHAAKVSTKGAGPIHYKAPEVPAEKKSTLAVAGGAIRDLFTQTIPGLFNRFTSLFAKKPKEPPPMNITSPTPWVTQAQADRADAKESLDKKKAYRRTTYAELPEEETNKLRASQQQTPIQRTGQKGSPPIHPKVQAIQPKPLDQMPKPTSAPLPHFTKERPKKPVKEAAKQETLSPIPMPVEEAQMLGTPPPPPVQKTQAEIKQDVQAGQREARQAQPESLTDGGASVEDRKRQLTEAQKTRAPAVRVQGSEEVSSPGKEKFSDLRKMWEQEKVITPGKNPKAKK